MHFEEQHFKKLYCTIAVSAKHFKEYTLICLYFQLSSNSINREAEIWRLNKNPQIKSHHIWNFPHHMLNLRTYIFYFFIYYANQRRATGILFYVLSSITLVVILVVFPTNVNDRKEELFQIRTVFFYCKFGCKLQSFVLRKSLSNAFQSSPVL